MAYTIVANLPQSERGEMLPYPAKSNKLDKNLKFIELLTPLLTYSCYNG